MIDSLQKLLGSPDLNFTGKSTLVTAYVIVVAAIIRNLCNYIAPSFAYAGDPRWQTGLLAMAILPLFGGYSALIGPAGPIIGIIFIHLTLTQYEQPDLGSIPIDQGIAAALLAILFFNFAFGSVILALIFPSKL